MSKRTLFLVIIPVLVVLALFAGSSSSFAQGPTGSGTQGMVSAAFTYQGRLKDGGGNPVNNTCDFTFSAWDTFNGGTQVGSDCSVTAVQVVDGYFTVQLNTGGEFSWAAFLGDARWLQVAVKCSGDAGYTALTPRQELTAAPYALGLKPGAWAQGDVSGGGAINGKNTNTSNTAAGLYGESTSTEGIGVWGVASSATGVTYGVYGQADSHRGSGVYGWAGAATGENYGVYGESESADGTGVYGTAPYVAVEGKTDSGTGVWGWASGTSGTSYGVYGQVQSTDGTGVYGTGPGWGVYGTGNVGVEGETGGWLAVFGNNTSTDVSSAHIGVAGQTAGTDVANRNSVAVQGYATNTAGGIGVRGVATGAGIPVLGENMATSGGSLAYGVEGLSNSTDNGVGVYGTAPRVGVEGRGTAAAGYSAGVLGESDSPNGYAVHGYAGSTTGVNYAIFGKTESLTDGYGGYFVGNVHVQGTLSKSAGSFKIDDPLDPANKYLYHSFVESPDMMNIYNGNVVLDADGAAWVQMPAWFEALNGSDPSDYRYQLTPVGGPMPNLYVAQDIQDNRFQIAGGTPGLRVSWMVTGIRHDPYAEAHRIPVEQDKPAKEQGTYLYPKLYGQPDSAGVDYGKRPVEPAAAASPAPVPAAQPR